MLVIQELLIRKWHNRTTRCFGFLQMILCTVFCVVRFHKPSSHLYFLPPFCSSSSPPSFLTNPFYSLLCSLSVVLSGEAGWATHIGQLHLENLQEEKGCEKKITNERIKKDKTRRKKRHLLKTSRSKGLRWQYGPNISLGFVFQSLSSVLTGATEVQGEL